MLRIHFTPDDLARTHLAHGPDPFWESVLSMHMLYRRAGGSMFDDWRRQVRGRVPRWTQEVLLPMAPPYGSFADFLTPSAGSVGFAEGADAIMATPPVQLRRDLDLLAGQHPLPSWVAALGTGEMAVLERIVDAVRCYHDAALRPIWEKLSQAVEADRAVRRRALADGGVERLLASLPYPIRWERPVLSSAYPGADRDLYLEGRGLLLVPSYFCWGTPVTLVEPSLPPVLVYPIDRHALPEAAPVRGGLDALLGRTRAATLRAVAGGATTSEVARLAGVSASAASQHTAVLRQAGLVESRRVGGSMLHTATALGRALLAQGPSDGADQGR